MFLDAQLQFSDEQAVTADALSDNILDCSKARNIFDGVALGVLIAVHVAADHTTGDETYSFELRTSAASDMSGSTTLVTRAIAAATLVAGYKFVLPIPVGQAVLQYLAVYYDVGGTTPTITVDAFLVPLDYISLYTAYADNVTIS